MPLSSFHLATQSWFKSTFPKPTAVQAQAWQSIVSGQHTLLAAPTGSGKTLAAFLASIDRLLKEGHTTTLIFVNTRRLAERVTKNLAERLGNEVVMAHHGRNN